MAARIVVRVAGKVVREMDVAKFPFIIGRDPLCDLPVNQPVLSRQHCVIEQRENQFFVKDLGSTNGTTVNGDAVSNRPLQNGDVIGIGDVAISFQLDGPKTEHGPENAKPVQAAMEEYSLHTMPGQNIVDMPSLPRVTDVNKASRMFYILYQLSKKLSLLVNLDDLLKISMESIFHVIRADRGLLFLRNKENELYVKFAFSREQGFIQPGTMKVSSTVLKRALDERVAILTSDAMHDPRFSEQMSVVQQKIRSVLCAPLWDDEDSYGTIYLDSISRTYAFTEDDRALLTGIANLIAIRMKQEQLHDRLASEHRLRTELAKYHSPDVVELLVRQHGKLDTGRREVTVLFADIQNSTGIAEKLGEDEVHKLLNHFYELASEAVFRNQGHVNKFIGDAILGLFNAPLEVAGHECRGVGAARDMISAIKQYNAQNPNRAFRLRVGINTGWVIAGNIGPQNRLEYTVIGDAVNVAERLCKVETSSSVAVSEDTWKRLNGQFKGRDLGELVLKGRAKPVRIYEVEV